MVSVGRADVSFHLSPEILAINDGTQLLNIVLSSNPGTDQVVGAMGFDFDIASEAWAALDPTDFVWVPDELNDPNLWFTTTDLPNPVMVNFGVNGIPIPDGVDVTFAALTVTPNTAGTFSLSLGVNGLADPFGQPLQVKGGDPSDITIIVPEPAGFTVLALGALALMHRRR